MTGLAYTKLFSLGCFFDRRMKIAKTKAYIHIHQYKSYQNKDYRNMIKQDTESQLSITISSACVKKKQNEAIF